MQTVALVIEIVRKKYERTRMENLEERVIDWLSFKENNYEEEDESLLVMEVFELRKNELKIIEKNNFKYFCYIKLGKDKE